jgi:hypothetical protein
MTISMGFSGRAYLEPSDCGQNQQFQEQARVLAWLCSALSGARAVISAEISIDVKPVGGARKAEFATPGF